MNSLENPGCDYVVVMTACIDPGGRHPGLRRRDPETRKQDYQTALRFWVTHPDPRLRRVVFIENTGHPLQEFEESAAKANVHGKELEFISLECNECPPGVSYGYPELAMIDLSMSQSRLIRQSRYLIKATGRLRFPDLPRLLDRLPEDYLFAVDNRNYRLPGGPPMSFTTTQLMIFSVRFYTDHLIGLRENLTPALPLIEHLFYEKLMTFQGQPGAILRWPVSVDPRGMAGHGVKDYGSPKQRVISIARAACRVLLPGWWA
jgi:hypothetical protein